MLTLSILPGAKPQIQDKRQIVPPKCVINWPEEIPLPKLVPLHLNESRLNRKAHPNTNPSVLDQMDTITPTFHFKNGNPLNFDKKKLYKTNIKAVMKRIDPPQKTWFFFYSNPHDVINLLNRLGFHTAKAYYKSIVRYLPIARPISEQHQSVCPCICMAQSITRLTACHLQRRRLSWIQLGVSN